MVNVNNITNTLYKKGTSKKYAVKLTKLKEGEKISIFSDVMFKTMFQTTGREKFPSKLISYYTNYSFEELMENLVFEKNELDKTVANKKGLRCDFVGNIDGIKLNIEINNNSSLETMERNMEYTFRLYASKVRSDSEYEYTKVIQLNIREKPPVELEDEKLFFKIIKASFMQRRKTLINGLSNSGIISKEEIRKILNSFELSENTRGEELNIKQFADITNYISSKAK